MYMEGLGLMVYVGLYKCLCVCVSVCRSMSVVLCLLDDHRQ